MRQVPCPRSTLPCAHSCRQISRRVKAILFMLQVAVLLTVASGVVQPLVGQTAVNSPTWRYDTTHSGANTQETVLTPANVNATTFGKLFSRAVDGYVYAQPLYMSGLTMSDGLVHNVVFVMTEHDSIYAFDADTNGGANAQPLWQISLFNAAYGAAAGATTVPSTDLGTSDIIPEIGITGTAAINPATQTMYVVGKTKENGNYIQRLHAINIITGAEQANSPTVIQATVPGSGQGSSGGSLPFSSMWEMNRGALNYYNGYVYVPFGAHGDNGPWHGWVFGYNATTLAQTGVINLSPSGYGNGIWESGAGLPIDNGGTGGRMFVALGNGTYSAYPPLNNSVNYGNSIVDLSLANGALTPLDAFTPFNQSTLTASDVDQGSGGVLMLPNQQGANPHILVQIGKEGRILVLNRDNLGGYVPGGSSNPNALQDITGQTKGLWSTPAYWNGNVYMWGTSDYAKMFGLNSGVLNSTYSSESGVYSAFPAPSFTISSNGTQNGIAWGVTTFPYQSNGAEVLYAFDATNLANILYESDTNSARDGAGPANKFVVPVVTNGKVYLGAAYQLDVYGLLNGQPTAVAPVISPNGGAFNTAQTVKLTSSTAAANIYYTLDGSVPTTAATLYTAPFTVSTNTVVKAMANATNYIQSAVSSATFTFVTQTPTPVFTPAGGTYATAQQVALTDTDASAAVYYTLDGSSPTAASTKYTAPITVSAASTTINAIAIDPALQNSSVASATYVIQAGATSINFGSGFSSTAGLTLNGSTIATDDSRMQLTNGSNYEAGSVFYNNPISIQAFTTDFSFQLSSAVADGFTFAIQNTGVNALGNNGGALGYAPIGQSVAIKFDLYSNAGEGTDSTGVYTNGAVPETPFVDMTSSGLQLNSGDSIQAHVTYDGTTLIMKLTDVVSNTSFTLSQVINIPQIVGGNTAYVGFTGATGGYSASQKILTWTYTAQAPGAVTAAPAFSPAGGNFTTPQNVTLSDTTAGAVIHYTTNGTTPTATSATYSAPIAVSYGTTAIQALAIANGVSSAVSSATYTVTQATAPTPVFTPAAGTYVGTQSVTIADTDASAVIYYTTNGSQPTSASNLYTGAIPVAASTTINAIAIDPALQNSSVAAAAYVINSAATTINYSTGFPSTAGLTVNRNAAVASNLLQLTNTTNQLSSVFYSTPVNVQSFVTNFTFQLQNAQADGFTFTLQNAGTTALGIYGGSLGYGSPNATGGIGQSVAVKFDFYSNAGEGTDSTGIYTNGAYPTTPAVDMTSSGVVLSSGDTMQAQLSYNGTVLTLTLTDTVTKKTFTTNFTVNIPQVVGANTAYVGFTAGTGGYGATQNILSWTYSSGTTATPVTATPVFTPVAGSYTAAQSVTIADSTTGAVIYYTTNGTTPTTASAVYSGAIPAGVGTTTIEALAVAPNDSPSTIATAVYKVTPVTAAPVFTPAAGSFTAAQTVTIADTTAGAVIYYTTNGTTPTTASAVYNKAIAVGAGTTTIEALAVAPNYSQSSVTTAVYKVTPLTAAPVFTPAAGNYAAAQNVTITDATTGAVIYYTTNGTTPTTASTVYKGAIAVGAGTTTIEALALAPNYTQSGVTTATYKVTLPATVAPAFSPAAGTYSTTQTVTLSDTSSGAVIYYTTDGTTPTTASAVYSKPIAVAASETIEAIAIAPGAQVSTTASAAYVIQATPPAINFASGFASATTLSLNGVAMLNGAALQLTPGSQDYKAASAWFNTPVSVTAFSTDFNFQLLNAGADGLTFTIQGQGLSAIGSSGSGLGYGAAYPGGPVGITNSVAIKFDIYNNNGEGSDSTGFYTNGVSPTTPAVDMTASGVTPANGDVMHAHITYDGTTLTLLLTDTTTSASFTTSSAINIPTIVGGSTAYVGFTAGVGGYSMTSNILNWTYTPTTTQAVKTQVARAGSFSGLPARAYSAILLPASTRRQRVNISLVKDYDEQPAAPLSSFAVMGKKVSSIAGEPQFRPAPGKLAGNSDIRLHSDTPDAVIHYTTDGAQPTRNSAVYHAPIAVNGTSLTIKAFAGASGMKDSAVVTGMYRLGD